MTYFAITAAESTAHHLKKVLDSGASETNEDVKTGRSGRQLSVRRKGVHY